MVNCECGILWYTELEHKNGIALSLIKQKQLHSSLTKSTKMQISDWPETGD